MNDKGKEKHSSPFPSLTVISFQFISGVYLLSLGHVTAGRSGREFDGVNVLSFSFSFLYIVCLYCSLSFLSLHSLRLDGKEKGDGRIWRLTWTEVEASRLLSFIANKKENENN